MTAITSNGLNAQTRRPAPAWQLGLLSASLVLACALLSMQLARDGEGPAAIWPGNAILLVILLRSRRTLWPLLLACGYVGNVVALWAQGDAPFQIAILPAFNSLETALVAYGVTSFGRRQLDLERPRDFAIFSGFSMLGPLVSGGAFALYLWTKGESWRLTDALSWALTANLGLFVLTPALLILTDRRHREDAVRAFGTGTARGPFLMLGALMVLSIIGPWHSAYLLAPPFLVLIALQFEMAGAAAAMLALSLFSMTMIIVGLPPALLSGSLSQQLLKVQFFLAITAAVILPLGSVISQRSAFRRDLAEALRRAEAGAAAKSEFLANMSHELRTPLTSIIGFAGLLEEDDGLDERQSRYVKRINDASRALLSVINDVLDFSKLDGGEVELDPRPTDPMEVIHRSANLVSLQAEAKGLAVLTDASPTLPASLLVDDGRLSQILTNLLGNAVKFTERGHVRVFAAWADDRLTVTVSDTGPGVPADRIDRLFQRFSQADSSVSRRYGGTGLGLAICRSLTELMGGSIAVQSSEKGSTFTFDIRAPRAAAPAPVQAAPTAHPPGTKAACKVLLVDDALANRELVRALLQAAGFGVTEAIDGARGLEAALAEPYDLILMDVRMPGIDGMEATRRLRAQPGPNQSTPVLALTAEVQAADVQACRAAGMNDHVAKPVVVADLIGKAIQWARTSAVAGA